MERQLNGVEVVMGVKESVVKKREMGGTGLQRSVDARA
jgi:hypothetical protein